MERLLVAKYVMTVPLEMEEDARQMVLEYFPVGLVPALQVHARVHQFVEII